MMNAGPDFRTRITKLPRRTRHQDRRAVIAGSPRRSAPIGARVGRRRHIGLHSEDVANWAASPSQALDSPKRSA